MGPGIAYLPGSPLPVFDTFQRGRFFMRFDMSLFLGETININGDASDGIIMRIDVNLSGDVPDPESP